MIPLRKRAKRWARYVAIRIGLALASLLPLGAIEPLGRWLGRLAHALLRREREQAMSSLEIAFPERSIAERTEIARSMFQQLALSAIEIALARKLDGELERYVALSPEAEATYRAALGRGRGAVFVTAHLGNWELLARRIARIGLPCATIGKESHDARITTLIERLRSRGRLRTIWRGEPGAVKQMLRLLKSGGALGMLIDQDTRVQGVFVEFFGRPAFTPRAAADLVLRTGAAALFGFIHRSPNGHRVELVEIAPPSGRGEHQTTELTQRFTREIEVAIRAHPEEWVWMHRRWKTRPPNEAALSGRRSDAPSATA